MGFCLEVCFFAGLLLSAVFDESVGGGRCCTRCGQGSDAKGKGRVGMGVASPDVLLVTVSCNGFCGKSMGVMVCRLFCFVLFRAFRPLP